MPVPAQDETHFSFDYAPKSVTSVNHGNIIWSCVWDLNQMMVYDRNLHESPELRECLFKPEYLSVTHLTLVSLWSRCANYRENHAIHFENGFTGKEHLEE
jgi:hypothetical protein